MSADHHSITETLPTRSEIIDLGLALPENFDIEPVLTVERLLRLHPNWFVSDLSQDGDSFNADINDYATEKNSKLSGTIAFNKDKYQVMRIELTGTVKIVITFSNLNNSLAVQTRSQQTIDGDDPILLWIRAIREYIRLYAKKTLNTLLFRILMNRMVLQMNPSQRKISMMLVKITIVEILVIVFILVGYTIFVL